MHTYCIYVGPSVFDVARFSFNILGGDFAHVFVLPTIMNALVASRGEFTLIYSYTNLEHNNSLLTRTIIVIINKKNPEIWTGPIIT